MIFQLQLKILVIGVVLGITGLLFNMLVKEFSLAKMSRLFEAVK